MTVKQDLDALLAAVDAGTTAVAARLDRISQGVKNAMTDAEVADVKAKLQGEADHLVAMGQDQANPIPPPPPAAGQ